MTRAARRRTPDGGQSHRAKRSGSSPTPPSLSVDERAGLLDLAFDAIFAHSVSDHTIVYWNRGAERLYGWTSSEAVGRHKVQLLNTTFPEPLRQIERELLQTGTWEGQLVQQHKDGRWLVVASRWATRTGDGTLPDLILEINRDLTPRVEAERRLDETDEMLRLLVSSVREYAMFVLDPQGRIVTWNDGAWRLTQYARDEIMGQHFSVFYDAGQQAAGKPDRELLIAEREGQFEEEGWRLRKDGSRFWANVLITALRDPGGELRGFAKITRDLTEKHLEAQRLGELEAVKSEFLRLASHELRGPVGTLRGYTSMLQDGAFDRDPAARARAYQVLDAKARHLAMLTNQMLEMARLEDGRLHLEFQGMDLRAPVAQAYEEACQLAPACHELRLEQPDEPILVEGDELRLITIVQHLIDNAVKYSPNGGTVIVRVEASAQTAAVEVRDEGIGIADEDMPTLFTRFGRVVSPENSHIPGAGLGLYLCQELALMHRGEVTVSSQVGKGSTFRLQLPLA